MNFIFTKESKCNKNWLRICQKKISRALASIWWLLFQSFTSRVFSSLSRHFECECTFACEQNVKIANAHTNTCIFVGWFTTSDLRHSNKKNLKMLRESCLLVKWMLICMYNFIWFTQSSSNIHSNNYSLRAHLCSATVWSFSHLDTWSFSHFSCNLKSIKFGFSTHFGHLLRSQQRKMSFVEFLLNHIELLDTKMLGSVSL